MLINDFYYFLLLLELQIVKKGKALPFPLMKHEHTYSQS